MRSNPRDLPGPPGPPGPPDLPAGVVEPIAAEDLAAGAGIDVLPARRLVERRNGVADLRGVAAQVGERGTAARRDGALHRTRFPEREPLMIEAADHLAFVAAADEAV